MLIRTTSLFVPCRVHEYTCTVICKSARPSRRVHLLLSTLAGNFAESLFVHTMCTLQDWRASA